MVRSQLFRRMATYFYYIPTFSKNIYLDRKEDILIWAATNKKKKKKKVYHWINIRSFAFRSTFINAMKCIYL